MRAYFHLSEVGRKLSDHGFTVQGYREGSCPGSHHLSIEESPETIEMRLDYLQNQLAREERRLAQLPRATEFTFIENKYDPQLYQYVPQLIKIDSSDRKFEKVKQNEIQKAEASVRRFIVKIEEAEKELDRWAPQRLKTAQKVEQEALEAKQREKRAASSKRFDKHREKNSKLIHKLFIQLKKKEDVLHKVMKKGDSFAIHNARYDVIDKIKGILSKFGSPLNDLARYGNMTRVEALTTLEVQPVLDHLGLSEEFVAEDLADWRYRDGQFLEELGVSDPRNFHPAYPGF